MLCGRIFKTGRMDSYTDGEVCHLEDPSFTTNILKVFHGYYFLYLFSAPKQYGC